ncbi:AraC family transcriptional regulator [Bradyrhizobium sp.]|uniref:AraC family transcriptional regulator n=1 Tax=Bradyrhizobium sp. TaxID=376 RepID=UPI0039E3642E
MHLSSSQPHRATALPASAAVIQGNAAIRKRAEELQIVRRPIAALASEYPSGGVGRRHSHRRAQFMHSLTGVLTVITDDGTWSVSPRNALWIPPSVAHQVRCWGHIQLRTLYIEQDVVADMPTSCQLIEVSPLLRELVNEATTFSQDEELRGREEQITSLILGELVHVATAESARAPMPADRRLVRICGAIMRDPSNSEDIDHWARYGNIGRRTLTRLFRKETGMSFVEWRQHVRLLEALSRLSTGEPVTHVALDLGYGSPSAFTAMFRRALGASPRNYLRWTDREADEH